MATSSRFAVSVHILAYLAYQAGRAVPSAEIARSVSTNAVVIRRLLSILVKAGIVTARKGVTGGFELARPPAEISLLEAYHAIEPRPTHGMNHFSPNHRCPVGARIEGILDGVFTAAQAGMEAELARKSVADVERHVRGVCPGKR
jgi:Rrf2 family protein